MERNNDHKKGDYQMKIFEFIEKDMSLEDREMLHTTLFIVTTISIIITILTIFTPFAIISPILFIVSIVLIYCTVRNNILGIKQERKEGRRPRSDLW